MRKSRVFRPTVNDKLEDRTVPSGFQGLATAPMFSFLENSGTGGLGFGLGGGGRAQGLGNFESGEFGRERGEVFHQRGLGDSSSNLLGQAAGQVQQAFQQFNASVLSALASLRQTATTTSGPTSDGLTAFNSAIDTATTTLNSSIETALSSLTNTGSSLASTIEGTTSQLATNLKSAATGLENSTSTAVLATMREMRVYLRTALGQSINTILTDQPTGTITPTTLQTYNQAVRTAAQTFRSTIANAAQSSLSSGQQLDSSTVSTAVTALKTSLDSAIANLGLPNQYDPTSTVESQLTTLSDQLTNIAAPTTGNSASGRLFWWSISSTISQDLGLINRTVLTAVQNTNNSLL